MRVCCAGGNVQCNVYRMPVSATHLHNVLQSDLDTAVKEILSSLSSQLNSHSIESSYASQMEGPLLSTLSCSADSSCSSF